MPKKPTKYEPEAMIPMFRLAATLRKQMLEAGLSDNGGAIHSAERILNLLGQRLCYPGLTHINNLRRHPQAAFSEDALSAHAKGERVLIEHVSPHREFTRRAIEQIEANVTDDEFKAFVLANFQLALLTVEETARLNKANRTKMAADRLASAGIRLAATRAPNGGGESIG